MQREFTQKATLEASGTVVRIFSATLTEQERARRMKAIQAATVALVKSKWSERNVLFR